MDYVETRTLRCGCEIFWDPQWFGALRRVGEADKGPGEEVLTEAGVLEELFKQHVCPKAGA